MGNNKIERLIKETVKDKMRERAYLRWLLLRKKLLAVFLFLALLSLGIIWWIGPESFLLTQLIGSGYERVTKPTMDLMKEKGCVYDGLLTPRYNANLSVSAELVKNTGCRYIHRAIETWNIPPDFAEIKRRMDFINRRAGKKIRYGMFLAESVDVNGSYYDPYSKRRFYFAKMCLPGSQGVWGRGTCKPSFARKEYRDYLRAVTRRAIDLGIEDFTFGQVYYQDPTWRRSSALARSIIAEIKRYGKFKGKDISVGAQTNDIDREEYLRSFDYITGGIGQDLRGNIQKEGGCWNYYLKRNGYCWAMLWDKKYFERSNDVLVYLDWNNSFSDDIHRFTRMDRQKRAKFLGRAYDFFLWRKVGFLSPLGEVLGNVPAGCHGPTPEFYSASNRYSCKDENAIKNILSGGNLLPGHSRFLGQQVPLLMRAGEKYQVRIRMQNTGYGIWKRGGGYRLRDRNLLNSSLAHWGREEVLLGENDMIKHNKFKDFVFTVTAPETAGNYVFAWQMFSDSDGFFGAPSDALTIRVVNK